MDLIETTEPLKIENLISFPLYACSKEIVRKYKPLLDELNLTYTQFITMILLWDRKESNLKELGNSLLLDSGTLTPLLKKLEAKGFIERERSKIDERNLIIRVTESGMSLRDKATGVSEEIRNCIDLSYEEKTSLFRILNKVLQNVREED